MAILEAMENVKENLEVLHKDGTNPYFNSGYTTLNAVMAELGDKVKEAGLVICQTVQYDRIEAGDKLLPYLHTTVTHLESGEKIGSEMPLIGIANMQNLGSAITYARRYSLVTMFGMLSEDDDGNSTTGKVKPAIDPFAEPVVAEVVHPDKKEFGTMFQTQKKGGE